MALLLAAVFAFWCLLQGMMGNLLPMEESGAPSVPEQESGAPSVLEPGEWRYECGRAGGWRSQCKRRLLQPVARGVVSGSRWRLRCPCSKPWNTKEYTIPWSRKIQSLSEFISKSFPACSRSGFGSASCYSRRRCRCLGNLVSAAFGGRCSSRASWYDGSCGGPGAETTQARSPEWEQGTAFSCSCSRRGGRPPASTAFYARAREAYPRSPFALGIHLRAAEGEPLPMLSHYYGRPASTEDMYDSLLYALTDRSFLTRI